MSPKDASDNPEKINEIVMNKDKPKFAVGNRVHFEKEFTHKSTNEIFKVHKVLQTAPITYELVDLHGESILGKFYSNELIRTEF